MTPADAGAMVEVFRTEQESEAFVVRGLLESGGIAAKIVSPSILPSIYAPGTGLYFVRVNPDQAEEARGFIESSQNSAGPPD